MMKTPLQLAMLVASSLVLLLCLVFLIRSTIKHEAEATREALTDAADSILVDNVRSTLESVVVHGGDEASDVLHSIRDILLGEAKPSPPSRYESQSEPRDVPHDTAPSSKSGGTSVLAELFRVGQEVAREVDDKLQEVIQLSDTEELEVGRQIHQAIRSQQDVVSNRKIEQTLFELASPFMKQPQNPNLPIKFAVVNSTGVNAFAHAGGYVYVTRGLLEFVRDDSELTFVLGHEIAHCALGHCRKQAAVAVRAGELSGGIATPLAQIAYNAVAVGFSEELELDADAWAFRRMGSDRSSAIAFLQRLAGTESSRLNSNNGEFMGQLDGHFATHPTTGDRADKLILLSKNLPALGE